MKGGESATTAKIESQQIRMGLQDKWEGRSWDCWWMKRMSREGRGKLAIQPLHLMTLQPRDRPSPARDRETPSLGVEVGRRDWYTVPNSSTLLLQVNFSAVVWAFRFTSGCRLDRISSTVTVKLVWLLQSAFSPNGYVRLLHRCTAPVLSSRHVQEIRYVFKAFPTIEDLIYIYMSVCMYSLSTIKEARKPQWDKKIYKWC